MKKNTSVRWRWMRRLLILVLAGLLLFSTVSLVQTSRAYRRLDQQTETMYTSALSSAYDGFSDYQQSGSGADFRSGVTDFRVAMEALRARRPDSGEEAYTVYQSVYLQMNICYDVLTDQPETAQEHLDELVETLYTLTRSADDLDQCEIELMALADVLDG